VLDKAVFDVMHGQVPTEIVDRSAWRDELRSYRQTLMSKPAFCEATSKGRQS
jgi:hypothetical protein